MSPIHNIGKSRKGMRDSLRFVTFRVRCRIWLGDDREPTEGFGFASDVTEDGAWIFLSQKVAKGTAARVLLEEETETPYRGMVTWCRRFSLNQRFHPQASFDYIAGVQFFFESENDRQRYLMYVNDLRKRAAAVPNQFKF